METFDSEVEKAWESLRDSKKKTQKEEKKESKEVNVEGKPGKKEEKKEKSEEKKKAQNKKEEANAGESLESTLQETVSRMTSTMTSTPGIQGSDSFFINTPAGEQQFEQPRQKEKSREKTPSAAYSPRRTEDEERKYSVESESFKVSERAPGRFVPERPRFLERNTAIQMQRMQPDLATPEEKDKNAPNFPEFRMDYESPAKKLKSEEKKYRLLR